MQLVSGIRYLDATGQSSGPLRLIRSHGLSSYTDGTYHWYCEGSVKTGVGNTPVPTNPGGNLVAVHPDDAAMLADAPLSAHDTVRRRHARPATPLQLQDGVAYTDQDGHNVGPVWAERMFGMTSFTNGTFFWACDGSVATSRLNAPIAINPGGALVRAA